MTLQEEMGLIRNNVFLQRELRYYGSNRRILWSTAAVLLFGYLPFMALGSAFFRRLLQGTTLGEYLFMQHVPWYMMLAYLASESIGRHRRAGTAQDIFLTPVPTRELFAAKVLPLVFTAAVAGIVLMCLTAFIVEATKLGFVSGISFISSCLYFLATAIGTPAFAYSVLLSRRSVKATVCIATFLMIILGMGGHWIGDEVRDYARRIQPRRYRPIESWTGPVGMGAMVFLSCLPWLYVGPRFRKLFR